MPYPSAQESNIHHELFAVVISACFYHVTLLTYSILEKKKIIAKDVVIDAVAE